MKKNAIIVSGYFNPLHKGHLEYFQNAKKLADFLFVIVNSDHQRALKQSKEFQLEQERMLIVGQSKKLQFHTAFLTFCALLSTIIPVHDLFFLFPFVVPAFAVPLPLFLVFDPFRSDATSFSLDRFMA